MKLTFFQKIGLLAIDLVLILASFSLIFVLRFQLESVSLFGVLGLWFIAVIVLGALYVTGNYDLDDPEPYRKKIAKLVLALFASGTAIVAIHYFLAKTRDGIFGRGVLIGSLLMFAILSSTWRRYVYLHYKGVRAQFKMLVIYSQEYFDFLEGDLKKKNLFEKCEWVQAQNLDLLKNKISNSWSTVVIAINNNEYTPELGDLLMGARFSGQTMYDLTSFYEKFWSKVPVYYLNQAWFVTTDGFNIVNNLTGLRIKRLIDIAISGALLILALPVMLITSLLIKIESRGPVFFSQIRTGKNGRDFVIYKFRSMRTDAEKDGAQWAQKNDSRVTRIGKIIRLTRIDELPQLINVLKGQMSFVGPRPERPEFNVDLEKKIPFYNMRHTVSPGLTGWAQVLYPYGASIEDSKEKLQYELYYIKNYSLLMDIEIILQTVQVVLFGRGR